MEEEIHRLSATKPTQIEAKGKKSHRLISVFCHPPEIRERGTKGSKDHPREREKTLLVGDADMDQKTDAVKGGKGGKKGALNRTQQQQRKFP